MPGLAREPAPADIDAGTRAHRQGQRTQEGGALQDNADVTWTIGHIKSMDRCLGDGRRAVRTTKVPNESARAPTPPPHRGHPNNTRREHGHRKLRTHRDADRRRRSRNRRRRRRKPSPEGSREWHFPMVATRARTSNGSLGVHCLGRHRSLQGAAMQGRRGHRDALASALKGRDKQTPEMAESSTSFPADELRESTPEALN